MELVLVGLIGLIVIVTLLASRLNDSSFPFPFDAKPTVFTPAEKNFQNLVEKALGEKYRVINRVKLADVMTVRKGVSTKAGQTAINNANNKYLDFVICDRDTMKLLGAVDLVDTNGKGYKVKKDWFVSGALEAASVPHIRIKVKPNYSVEEIRACIVNKLLGKTSAPSPKVKGRIIPAPMVKPRPKSTGAITSHAAKELAAPSPANMAARIPAPQIGAVSH